MALPPPTPGQARVIWLALTGLAIATLAALVAGLVWALGQTVEILSPVLWPIAVAAVVACLLDPLVDWLERRKIPRTRAVLCVFVLAVAVVAAVAGSVVPQAMVEAKQLVSRIPAYASRLQTRVEDWADHPPPWIQQYLEARAPRQSPIEVSTNNPATTDVTTNTAAGATTPQSHGGSLLASLDKETLRSAGTWLAGLAPVIGAWLFGRVSLVASVFGLLAGLFLIPIYAFYFLKEKRGISARWRDYLPVKDSKFKDELVFALDAINDYLIAFFRGQVLVGICNGILYTIGFSIIGLPYAVLIGVMATFLTIIPFIGNIITCIVALSIALAGYGDWQHPLLVVLVVGLVVSLENAIIAPRIMGDRVGLHPLVIIIALMVGTTLLGGFLGGILAIPLAAALRVIMFRYVWKRRV